MEFVAQPCPHVHKASPLGHSTITTTMDLYSHVTDTMQAEAAARLDMAFQTAKTRLKG